MDDLSFQALGEQEWWRHKRWHKTYNAALTGVYGLRCPVDIRDAHESAKAAADLAHGELKKK